MWGTLCCPNVLIGAPKNNTFDTRRVKAGLLDVEATAAKLGEKFGGEKGGAAAAQAGRAVDQGLKRLSVGVGKLGGGIGSFGRHQKSSASEANNNDDDDIEQQQQNEALERARLEAEASARASAELERAAAAERAVEAERQRTTTAEADALQAEVNEGLEVTAEMAAEMESKIRAALEAGFGSDEDSDGLMALLDAAESQGLDPDETPIMVEAATVLSQWLVMMTDMFGFYIILNAMPIYLEQVMGLDIFNVSQRHLWQK